MAISKNEVVVIEHHPNDSREKIAKDGICQTLNARIGTGGGNVPIIIVKKKEHKTRRIIKHGRKEKGNKMKHLGDITKINGAEIPPVDCITAGSPCQDLSVAGKRAGLDGERSGLFMEQIRIIKEMREHERGTNKRTDEFIRPRYMVWENVPGALSSGKDKDGNKLPGEDFRCVLEETARVSDPSVNIPRPNNGKWSKAGIIMGNGWSMAWRIHDAQHWGVAQRRKRLALVADFGGGSAPALLFERKGLRGDFEESEQTRERAPERTGGSAHETGGPVIAGVDCYNLNTTGEVVRRLTPLECERLQGYPDNWTLIGEPEEVEVKDYEIKTDEDGNVVEKKQVGTHTEIEYFYTDSNGKKKKCSDSARYKALGNSIALPFWFWLLRRISAQYERPATLGSLFDGIGGFPLCWERCNGEGTALWASEIEEFPIAVTTERFQKKAQRQRKEDHLHISPCRPSESIKSQTKRRT